MVYIEHVLRNSEESWLFINVASDSSNATKIEISLVLTPSSIEEIIMLIWAHESLLVLDYCWKCQGRKIKGCNVKKLSRPSGTTLSKKEII